MREQEFHMFPATDCVLVSSDLELETTSSVALDVGEEISFGGGGGGGAAEGVGFVGGIHGKGAEEVLAVGEGGGDVHSGVIIGEICGKAVVVPCVGGGPTADVGVWMGERGRE